MTFVAKEATGMWEREAEAPPCKGQQCWGETCWVQARFRCETQASHMPSLSLGFPSLIPSLGLDGRSCPSNDLGSPVPTVGGERGKGPD